MMDSSLYLQCDKALEGINENQKQQ